MFTGEQINQVINDMKASIEDAIDSNAGEENFNNTRAALKAIAYVLANITTELSHEDGVEHETLSKLNVACSNLNYVADNDLGPW